MVMVNQLVFLLIVLIQLGTAEKFYKFLRDESKKPNYHNKLAHIQYTVFACGDSSYPKYCEMGRVLLYIFFDII